MDEQAENGATRISVTTIYDTIKRSNSSLNRKPKRILEDSIERVVAVIQGDEEEEDSVEGDFEGLEEPAAPVSHMRGGRYGLLSFPEVLTSGCRSPTV